MKQDLWEGSWHGDNMTAEATEGRDSSGPRPWGYEDLGCYKQETSAGIL